MCFSSDPAVNERLEAKKAKRLQLAASLPRSSVMCLGSPRSSSTATIGAAWRPVRHRTDAKVRAHVALCMLALYVQRELTAKLKKEGISAEQALEQLGPCRLSLYTAKGAGGDAYVLPQIGRQEIAVLRRLGLTRLVDQRELGAALTPRSEFVPTEPDETA